MEIGFGPGAAGAGAVVGRDLLAGPRLDRVRRCANPECGWLFLDDSRAGKRRWCSMQSCGNRAKASATTIAARELRREGAPDGTFRNHGSTLREVSAPFSAEFFSAVSRNSGLRREHRLIDLQSGPGCWRWASPRVSAVRRRRSGAGVLAAARKAAAGVARVSR